jgi:acyl carrier protein
VTGRPTVAMIKSIVAQVKGATALAEGLPDSASLLEDVGLDSLELLQFMLEAEARLGIRIDFERLDYSYLHSIARLAEFFDGMPPAVPPRLDGS